MQFSFNPTKNPVANNPQSRVYSAGQRVHSAPELLSVIVDHVMESKDFCFADGAVLVQASSRLAAEIKRPERLEKLFAPCKVDKVNRLIVTEWDKSFGSLTKWTDTIGNSWSVKSPKIARRYAQQLFPLIRPLMGQFLSEHRFSQEDHFTPGGVPIYEEIPEFGADLVREYIAKRRIAGNNAPLITWQIAIKDPTFYFSLSAKSVKEIEKKRQQILAHLLFKNPQYNVR